MEPIMLSTVLISLATLSAIVGVFIAAVYPSKCQVLERHDASPVPDYKTDEAGRTAWYQKHWALEKTRMRFALTSIGAYGVGLFSLIPLEPALKTSTGTSHAPLILMIVLTLSMWAVVIFSSIHNQREFNRRLNQR